MPNNDKLPTTKTAEPSQSSTRRRFLKNAAIGAPVVIASSAKPAWGAACMSGVMSVYHSGPQAVCNLSGGLSHGHWKTHYVGRNDGHFVNRNRSLGLKNKFKDKMNCYYVKDAGGNLHFSNCETSSVFGSYTCQQSLENGGSYQCELITALISASLRDIVGYPYTIADVEEIYLSVLSGDADANRVANMLEGIHKGAMSL